MIKIKNKIIKEMDKLELYNFKFIKQELEETISKDSCLLFLSLSLLEDIIKGSRDIDKPKLFKIYGLLLYIKYTYDKKDFKRFKL